MNKKTILLWIGCLWMTGTLWAQSRNENYIKTTQYKVPVQDTRQADRLSAKDKLVDIVYYDGLGRPKQTVQVGQGGFVRQEPINIFPNDWKEGLTATNFYNRNGGTHENKIIYGETPFGDIDLLWRCGNDSRSDADGGWNTDWFWIDRNKRYRYSVWVKRTGPRTNGRAYHGTRNVADLRQGQWQSNPYFWYGYLPKADTWYLMVGVVHPHTYRGGDTGVSGVYDMEGNKVIDGVEFRWMSHITHSSFRSYLYYSTDTRVRQYFYKPVLEKMDGSELSLDVLIAGGRHFDLSTPVVYDELGRQTKEYLPNPGITEGKYTKNQDLIKQAEDYYKNVYLNDFSDGVINIYSEQRFESSPEGRLLEQGAPGTDWKVNPNSDSGHTVKYSYQTNHGEEVLYYYVDFPSGDSEQPVIKKEGYYGANQLYKKVTRDENWRSGTDHSVEEFTNKQGQVVLKRSYNKGSKHDTYYVYDDYGNLTYVIPPKAAGNIIKLMKKRYDRSFNLSHFANGASGSIRLTIDGTRLTFRASGRLNGTLKNNSLHLGLPHRVPNMHLGNLYSRGGARVWARIYNGRLYIQGTPYYTTVRKQIRIRNTIRDYYYRMYIYYQSKYYQAKYNSRRYYSSYSRYGRYSRYGYSRYGYSRYGYSRYNSYSRYGYSRYGSYSRYGGYYGGYNNNYYYNYYNSQAASYKRQYEYYRSLYYRTPAYFYRYITQYVAYSHNSSVNRTANKTFSDPNKDWERIDTDQEILDGLCYQYKYDHRNRMVEKKIAGKDWEYIVYDKQDRPSLTQDGNLRAQHQWLFTKYDRFGRVAYTGAYSRKASRRTIQSEIDGKGANNEDRASSTKSIGGITINYPNSAYPQNSLYLHSVQYYDDYSFRDNHHSRPSNVEGQAVRSGVNSLPTASWTRILNDGRWNKANIYYDTHNREIRRHTQHHQGGYTMVDSKLDFRGKPEYTITKHKRTSGDKEIVTKDTFEYDQAERLVEHTQKIGNLEQTIVKNHYGPTGMLESKDIGGGLQQVDYGYNIRGWLAHINEGEVQGNDLFGFSLSYNKPTQGGTALYNGNIAETSWISSTDRQLRHYRYYYDSMNRLTSARNGGAGASRYDVSLAYDSHGNIKTLDRNGWQGSDNGNYNRMDVLQYSYAASSNKLTKVQERGHSSYGFKKTSDYQYDKNGNLIKDTGKGITNIQYNHLNLPKQIDISGTRKGNIYYSYDASGVKLKKAVKEGNTWKTTEYLDGFMYEDGKLKMFPTAEGYAEPNGDSWRYVFQFKDHLGNVRMTYADLNKDGKIDPNTEILSQKNYYPFGGTQIGYNNVVNSNSNNVANRFQYNGKELEEELGLGLFDYHARHYDVSIARWTTIDPLAEDMTRHSPYNYAFNNPIYFIDPDGMAPEGIIDEDFDRDVKSTFVNERGEIIEHRDDGDPNIYIVTDPEAWDGSTDGLPIIGRETPGRSYTPGSLIYTDDIFYGAQLPDRFITFPYIGPQVNEFYSPLFDILGVGGWRKALSLIRGLFMKGGFKNVDALIKAAGKLNKSRIGTVKGNANQIFNSLTKGATKTSGGAYKLSDGTILNLHKSTTTKLPTISINRPGQKIIKIRIE